MGTPDTLGQLRPVTDRDLPMILAWRNAPEVRRNSYTQEIIPLARHLAWWEALRHDPVREGFIFERGGAPQGVVIFTDIDPRNRRASWAFYAAPDAPRGTGKRMEYLALDHAFGARELGKLCCEVLAFNTPVLGLHKAFGFRQEGLLRAHRQINGQMEDVVLLAIFASDWAARGPVKLRELQAPMIPSESPLP
jgi:UDP-4-amino-4,6-dideoxy-N-acetyl-beta-L-altrosamine N-acetyltransferase